MWRIGLYPYPAILTFTGFKAGGNDFVVGRSVLISNLRKQPTSNEVDSDPKRNFATFPLGRFLMYWAQIAVWNTLVVCRGR